MGHSIQSGFRAKYEQPGNPEWLGPPISDEFVIGRTTYQFFKFGAFSWEQGQDPKSVPVGVLNAGLRGRLGSPSAHPDGVISVEAALHLLAGDFDLQTAKLFSTGALNVEAAKLLAHSTVNADLARMITQAMNYPGSVDLSPWADALPGQRSIEVDLSEYMLTAWAGDIPISSR